MSELKQLRIAKNLTQKQASAILGISLRSYKSYENDAGKANTIKYRAMLQELEQHTCIDEEHGLLTLEDIKAACRQNLTEYDVKYCILFGSYAKGTPTPNSDVDLLISTSVSGLRFFGIAEGLRNTLHKKVDLLDVRQLHNNPALLDEILADGIKVYEQS